MGFYIDHLKSARAKRFAKDIEQQVSDYTGISTVIVIEFPQSGSKAVSDLNAAATAAYLDHPEWFHVSRECEFRQTVFSVSIRINLMYTVKQVRDLTQKVKSICQRIIESIPEGSTVWEKELKVFEYLQENVTYSTDDGECYSIIGALLNHRACCEGVSKAFALLCHELGIRCITVMDTEHMWNIIQLDGITAHVDITPGLSREGCDYSYFNVTDQDIAHNHGKAIQCVPKCTDYSRSFYAVNHTLFQNETELTIFIVMNYSDGTRMTPVKLLKGNIPNAVKNAAIFLAFLPQMLYCENTNSAEIML